MWKEAAWLGVPRDEIREKGILQGDMNGRFAYYRLDFELAREGELTVELSANSRYRLWVNGLPVLSGPCRSNEFRHYYETVELGSCLRSGRNVLAVQVLLCDSMYGKGGPGDNRAPLNSVSTLPAGHRLAVEGSVKDAAGKVLADVTTGKADWKVWLDNTFYLTKEPVVNGNMGALTEGIDFNASPAGWKQPGFDDSGWRSGEPLELVGSGFERMFGILKTFMMEQRPIPLMYERPASLRKELGEPVFGNQSVITVEPGRKVTLLFDGEGLFNAYFRYHFEGGRGAKISFTYFEKFTKGIDEVKRDDYINGEIGQNGQRDWIVLGGGSLAYEPFWYRTMRFLKIEIEAADEAVCFCRPELKKTGYPLEPGSAVKSQAAWVEKVYAMCVDTLQGCMMETYMDCPFWEQMQYPMDTRLQALFTYVCSVDTKLAKKALQDFHDSMLPVGLIQGRAPSNPKQIISTFSLHYIFMILEYYKRTGDREILKRYRADVDLILEYYDRHIGPQGLVEDLGYWDFVDWQETWHESAGRPAAVAKGPSTIINLMYGRALLAAAEINQATGRAGLAEEYLVRQQHIVAQIQALCWDPARGMYREGPECQEFSQHAQSWAVLNGMLSGQAAKEAMRRTFEEDDVLRCYFSTCYELFRACEEAGCYELTEKQMEWWIRLLEEHCTTCPETPSCSRSECHAWSALPMYELLSAIAGIRRESADPAWVEVCPHMEYLPDLQGQMLTEYGTIEFRYTPCGDEEEPQGSTGEENAQQGLGRAEKKRMRYEISLPKGMQGRFTAPSGTVQELKEGQNEVRE